MLKDETRLCISRDAVFQSLGSGQDTVLICLGSGYVYTCNDTTTAFLEALDGKRSLGEVVELMERSFDVSRARLLEDIRVIAERMLSEGLITMVNSNESPP